MKDKQATPQNIKSKVKDQKPKENQEVELLKAQLARALADYDNLRRRTQEEKYNYIRIAALDTATKLIPLLDMLEEAQKHLNDSGLAIVIKEFRSAIDELGVEEIKLQKGDSLYDNVLYTQVVDVIESDRKDYDNKIAEVTLSGWRVKGADNMPVVVRPASVKVYKAKEEQKAS